MIDKGTVMIFNGHEYKLSLVHALGKNGPSICVDAKEINSVLVNENHEQQVTFEPTAPDQDSIKSYGVIFVKQAGKYTVLIGREGIDLTGKVRGKLISSVALKKALVSNTLVTEVKPYDSAFANTPRIMATSSKVVENTFPRSVIDLVVKSVKGYQGTKENYNPNHRIVSSGVK